MIKVIDNVDEHTTHIINKKWISTKSLWSKFDDYKEDIEFNETVSHSGGVDFKYQKEGSYLDKGGYVVNLDL